MDKAIDFFKQKMISRTFWFIVAIFIVATRMLMTGNITDEVWGKVVEGIFLYWVCGDTVRKVWGNSQ